MTYKPVSFGVYESSGGYLYKENIPQDAPVVYEVGNSQDSGFIRRHWMWYNVVYVNDFDPRVSTRNIVEYRSPKDFLLADGRIVSTRGDNVSSVSVITSTDLFWRHDYPGKIQQEYEMLAKSESGKMRLEKWKFQ